jgi:hypothetical protein
MSSNRLTVNAADASAEISVLDGCLNRVARGIGRLEQDLAPGLYKVRVRVGPTVEDELVSLDQDRTVTKSRPRFRPPSRSRARRARTNTIWERRSTRAGRRATRLAEAAP